MINSFSIYRDYYELMTILSERECEKMAWAMFKYMFDDIDTDFSGNAMKIFNNLKRPLDKSKNKSKNGSNKQQNEIKIKSNENQNKIKTKSNKNQNEIKTKTHQDVNVNVNVYVNGNVNVNYILELTNNFNNLKNNRLIQNKIIDWLEYKLEKKDKYTEKGLNSLLTKIDNLLNDYEEQEIIELIDNSIVNNWKGIIWDNLKTKNKKTKEPSWFKNENKTEEMTKEEQEEMENILKEFGG